MLLTIRVRQDRDGDGRSDHHSHIEHRIAIDAQQWGDLPWNVGSDCPEGNECGDEPGNRQAECQDVVARKCDDQHEHKGRPGDQHERQECETVRASHLFTRFCQATVWTLAWRCKLCIAGAKVFKTGWGYSPSHSSATTMGVTIRASRGDRSGNCQCW